MMEFNSTKDEKNIMGKGKMFIGENTGDQHSILFSYNFFSVGLYLRVVNFFSNKPVFFFCLQYNSF